MVTTLVTIRTPIAYASILVVDLGPQSMAHQNVVVRQEIFDHYAMEMGNYVDIEYLW
jgi:hypothetical protein